MKKHFYPGDFLNINLDRIMTRDYQLSPWETIIMGLHALTHLISINDVKALGLDPNSVIEEKYLFQLNGH